MSVTKVDFEEKHHAIEVDGVEYEIPQRTPVLEDKIRELDENIRNLSEYEGNYRRLEILFGVDKAKQMFPERETTNLDKLAKVTKVSIALFMSEYQRLQSTALNDVVKNLKELEPVLSTVDKAQKALSAKQTADFVAKKRK